jgi:hypothetical protein
VATEVLDVKTEDIERAEALSSEPEEAGSEPIQISPLAGHIPAKFMTPKMREEIEHFLLRELNDAEMERSAFVKKLARWDHAYRAPLPDGPKHFPIFNASNLTVPVIKEAVNTLSAQLVQATDTARPRWIFKELAKEWEPFTDRLEQFLDLASDRDMNLSPVLTDWIVESAKLGTSILEMPWEVDERRIYKYDESGKRVYPSRVIMRDGPAPAHIPLQKFWIRFNERDVQKARWVGKELQMNEMDLLRRRDLGKFHSVDKIISRGEDRSTDERTKVHEKAEQTRPVERSYTIFEIWLSWDIDGDNRFEEIKVYFDRETGKLLGEFFNPYWHGKRPFIKLGYFPAQDRFYDEGLCEMLEQLQVGISSISNKRADNATLANLKMILKKRTVRNLNPGDPLYSGKIIEVTDPLTDVREFQLSEVYPSTVQEEGMMQQRVERVAGTNEGVAGAAMPVSRTTASAQIALLQEQAKRIDLAIRNIRRGIQEIGKFAIQLYSQYGTQGKAVAWMGTRGKEIEAVFRLPRRVIELGAALQPQTPTSMTNKQIQRENKLSMFNLLMQLHERLFELVGSVAPDVLPLVAAGTVKGAQKFMFDILSAFDETDPEGILSTLAVLERVLPQMEDMGGVGDLERRLESAEILERLSGLESLVQEAEAAAEDARGVSDERRRRERASPQERDLGGLRLSDLIGGQP